MRSCPRRGLLTREEFLADFALPNRPVFFGGLTDPSPPFFLRRRSGIVLERAVGANSTRSNVD